jgi:hypothetical protein
MRSTVLLSAYCRAPPHPRRGPLRGGAFNRLPLYPSWLILLLRSFALWPTTYRGPIDLALPYSAALLAHPIFVECTRAEGSGPGMDDGCASPKGGPAPRCAENTRTGPMQPQPQTTDLTGGTLGRGRELALYFASLTGT